MTTKEKRKKRKKRKKENSKIARIRGINRHHIIPSSQGGTDKEDNIAYVNIYDHRKYHSLFSNRNPEDIIEYLVKTFWNKNWGFVFEAIAKNQ